jgi:flagellar hook-associated protein 1 FlgK
MSNILTTLLNSANALEVYGSVFSTIQNNVTNANTPGYVKQDQSLTPLPFDPSAGLSGGVIAGPLISARSEYVEQSVRNQQEQLGSAQQKVADLGQVEPLFSLASGAGVPGALNKFFDSFSQLSVNPNDQASRQAVIDAAGQVAQEFHQNAAGIATVSTNADNQTRAAVGTVNQIAGQLAAINHHFQQNAGASQDAGLDAQLHAALENLSQVANFTVLKASDGTYSVYLGGQTPLVIGGDQFSVSADSSSPQTAIRDSQGNDITSQIDSGQLGALIEEKNTTLPGYLNSLNTLAQGFADTVNGALAQGVDKNGNPPAVNLFTYDPAVGAAFSLAAGAITPDQIAAALPTAPGGNANAIAIAALSTQPSFNGLTFTQAYGNLGGQVGRDVADAQQEQSAGQNLLAQAQAQRASQSAVSLDEEAAKLLQFQQAYQAVGKLVSTLNSLTQTLINIIP